MCHIKKLTLKITESIDEDKTRENFTPWANLFNFCTKKFLGYLSNWEDTIEKIQNKCRHGSHCLTRSDEKPVHNFVRQQKKFGLCA